MIDWNSSRWSKKFTGIPADCRTKLQSCKSEMSSALIMVTFDSTFEMSFTASLTADSFRKLGHVATPFVQNDTFPLPHLSKSAVFWPEFQLEFKNNSGEILEEFWRNSKRILEKFKRNSGKILEEFLDHLLFFNGSLPLVQVADHGILPKSILRLGLAKQDLWGLGAESYSPNQSAPTILIYQVDRIFF